MRTHRSQRGAVLGVALLLLTVLTLLALGASQLRRSQETATHSIQQRAVALQAAEAALRGAERLLESHEVPAIGSCTVRRCRIYGHGQLQNVSRRSADWWEEHAWAYSPADDEWIPAGPEHHGGRFVIEELAFVPDALTIPSAGSPSGRLFYRITAMAQPDRSVSPVVLQSIYARHVS